MADIDHGFEARKLLRGAPSATLATVTEGQPFAALVTHAVLPDLTILLLLSDLSEHSRHLKAEPRCALLVQGEVESANPQTAPRLSVTGLAEPAPDELRPRFLARHPYAALYAGFGDFRLWRIRPASALLVAGFARATRLKRADLLPDPAAVAALAEAEAGVLDHVNSDHADALAAIATGLLGRPAGDWRMTGLDPDGCDLAAGDCTAYLPWAAPVSDVTGVRMGLVRAAREGREKRAA